MEQLPSNIRVATWIGTHCLLKLAATQGLVDSRLTAFVAYLSELLTAEDIVSWDSRGGALIVTGMGDPLPDDMEPVASMHELIESVREISASQLYGAFNPHEVRGYLENAMQLSDMPLAYYDFVKLRQYEVDDGWGNPLVPKDLEACRNAA